MILFLYFTYNRHRILPNILPFKYLCILQKLMTNMKLLKKFNSYAPNNYYEKYCIYISQIYIKLKKFVPTLNRS